MKTIWFFLCGLVVFVVGCDDATVAVGCGDITTHADMQLQLPSKDGGECVPIEVTRTRVASEEFGTIVLICNACEIEGCNSLGARCHSAGAWCDFHGELGICTGCCDSEFGELHCGPVK